MKNVSMAQVWVVVAVVVTLVMNVLATSLPLGGKTTGELSDQYPVLVTPAGYVFGIWSLIYLGIAAYTIYQALPAQRDNPRVAATRAPFVVSSIANSTWIVLWHYEWVTLSLGAMLVLFGSLLMIYRGLAATRAQATRTEGWTLDRPFSLYLGWITVATIVNVTVVLYNLGWNGAPLTGALWAVLLIGIAALIGLAFIFRERNVVYGGVIAWALAGIAVKQGDVALVAGTAVIGSAIVLLAMGYRLLSDRRSGRATLPVPA